MHVSRRGFIKLTGAGLASLGLSDLGFDLNPVKAYASALKIEGAKEVVFICGFCSCGGNIIMSIKDGRMVSSEGDPDYPVSEGSLCSKGAAFMSMHYNEHRLQKPLYRAPESDRWEEKDWDFVLDRIRRVRTPVTRILFSQTTRASRSTGWKASSNSAPPRWTTRSALSRTKCSGDSG